MPGTIQVRSQKVFTYQRKTSVLNSNSLIRSDRSFLSGILLCTDGENAVGITIYNGIDSNTDKLIPTINIDADEKRFFLNFEPVLMAENGLYVEVESNGTCEFVVFYDF